MHAPLAKDGIQLRLPAPADERAALEFRDEFLTNRETAIHGASLLETMDTYSDWLAHLEACRAGRKPGWVPSTTFFAVRQEDAAIVGVVDVRHHLNHYLLHYGGHIGYAVRPTQRRQGCAKRMLGLALEFARGLGIDRVMISCGKDNTASAATILAHGGQLHEERLHPDGEPIKIYWIALE